MTYTNGAAVPPHSRKRTLTRLLVTGLLTVLSTAGVAAAQPAPAAAAIVRHHLAPSTYQDHVQYWINVERNQHGLPALRSINCADGTSKRWSHHLATTQLFYHQSMTSVLNQCSARYAGETLGRGAISSRRLVRRWMHSPRHRVIVLSTSPTRVGIGAELDRYGRWVVAANFVTP